MTREELIEMLRAEAELRESLTWLLSPPEYSHGRGENNEVTAAVTAPNDLIIQLENGDAAIISPVSGSDEAVIVRVKETEHIIAVSEIL